MTEASDSQGLVPKLRFPEFRDDGEWVATPLRQLCTPISEKVGNAKLTPVSITAGKGFVSQASKFGRDISGEQYRNYAYLRKGDFAYNKGNSTAFPQGYVCQLTEFDEAAASSAFLCFQLSKEHQPRFVQALFDQNVHGRQLASFITSGARSNGLLNIRSDDFYGVKLPLPPESGEQKKIAECLSALDARIAAETDKLAALRDHKKGLMQQLFPAEGKTTPRRRFPEFRNVGDWEEKSLGDICDLRAGRFVTASDIAGEPANGLFPCYGGNGLRGYTPSYTHSGTFPVVGRQGAHCGNVKFVTGKFHATEHAVVATPKSKTSVDWLYHQLVRLELNRFATGQAQPGLSVDVIERVQCLVPKDEVEQQKIADCLSTLDALIAEVGYVIDAFNSHKSGLMQQLFPSPAETIA